MRWMRIEKASLKTFEKRMTDIQFHNFLCLKRTQFNRQKCFHISSLFFYNNIIRILYHLLIIFLWPALQIIHGISHASDLYIKICFERSISYRRINAVSFTHCNIIRTLISWSTHAVALHRNNYVSLLTCIRHHIIIFWVTFRISF